MSDIIFDYLTTKLQQPFRLDGKALERTISSVVNHVSTLFFNAAKKKDAALIQLLDSTIHDSLDEFFSRLYSNSSRAHVRNRVCDKVHQQLVNGTFKQKPVPYAQFKFLKDNLAWMQDIPYIVTDVVSFTAATHEEYFNPQLMTEHETACVLLSGVRINDVPDFFKKLPEKLRTNKILLLMSDRAMTGRSFVHKKDFETTLSKNGDNIDPRLIDFVDLLNASILYGGKECLSELSSILLAEKTFIESHDQHMTRVKSAKSISQLLDIITDTTSGLKDLRTAPFEVISKDSIDACVRCANTEFEVYNAAAEKLESFSAHLIRNFAGLTHKVPPARVIDAVCKIFSTNSFKDGRFSKAVTNFDFKHTAQLIGQLFRELDADNKYRVMYEMISSLPVNLLTELVLCDLLNREDMVSLICEVLNQRLNSNRDVDSGRLSRLVGAGLSLDASLLSTHTSLNKEMQGHSTLTRYDLNQKFNIKDVVANFILPPKSDPFFEHAIKCKDIQMASSVDKKTILIPSGNSDMSFLNAKAL